MRIHRLLIGLPALCGLLLALPSSVVLNGSEVLAIVVPAALAAAAVAAGVRNDRRGAAAWTAAALTAAAIMVVVGVGVLTGSEVSGGVLGVLLVTALCVWLLAKLRARSAGPGSPPRPGTTAEGVAHVQWADRLHTFHARVRLLSPSVLAGEWRRTTAAMAAGLTPAARQALVERRAEILQEMERRDPAGIERWLAAGAAHPVDPTDFFDPHRTGGTEAA